MGQGFKQKMYTSANQRTQRHDESQTYSLLEVQLTGGRMTSMTIASSPALGVHLMQLMKQNGWLYAFNDNESLLIRESEIIAVKITNLTLGD